MTMHTITAPSQLCSSTARAWKDRAAKSLANHSEAGIDLSMTRFIDSSGLGVLLSLNKTLRAEGRTLRLLKPSSTVAQLIELTRLHRIFEIVEA